MPTEIPPNEIHKPVSAHFKMIFFSVLGLTAVCFAIMVYLSWKYDQPTDLQQQVFDWCKTFATAGAGAILGLLGGKSAS